MPAKLASVQDIVKVLDTLLKVTTRGSRLARVDAITAVYTIVPHVYVYADAALVKSVNVAVFVVSVPIT